MPKHTVILRRYSEEDESDKYYPIDTVGSAASANKLALKTSGEPGDILIVCDTAYISDLRKYAKSIFVVNADGVAVWTEEVPSKLRNNKKSINWLDAWEGSDVDPVNLIATLRLMTYFTDTLNLIVLELSRSTVHYASNVRTKEVFKFTIDSIVDYLSGVASRSHIIVAAKGVDNYFGISYTENVVAGVLASASYAVANNYSSDYEVAASCASDLIGKNEVSGIIRRHMPLAKLLLTLSSAHP